jgi:NTE family protein
LKNNHNIPKTQKALVLQGGGALGAYEVGVINTLVEKLESERAKDESDLPLFDIIAGTSIGAINAAVFVSNIVNRKKTWKEAALELEKFWTDEEYGLSSNPDFSNWWVKDENLQNQTTASEEGLRKYYSVKEYFMHGIPRVCTPPLIRHLDKKFGDQRDNLWLHRSIQPLENTIMRHSKSDDENDGDDIKKFMISTSWEKKQPRLLVCAVDVSEGNTVTFDSYYREEEFKDPLYQSNGITIDHVMASGTIPVFYDFRIIDKRQFCDGGLLSNTPFRELLKAHQEYWLKKIEDDDNLKIPDLEVYIVNLHPPTGSLIKEDDHDGVRDRINDIIFSDRNSRYDENAFSIATDCFAIIEKLKSLAESNMSKDQVDTFRHDLEKFLSTTKAKSNFGMGKTNNYKNVLNGMFKLTKVIRIQNHNNDYADSIYAKAADFTKKSIKDLIKKGREDSKFLLDGMG